MLVLAEISDKMASPFESLALGVCVALLVVLFGGLRWWCALTLVPLFAWVNGILLHELVLSDFGSLAMHEMGTGYVVSFLAAFNLPILIAAVSLRFPAMSWLSVTRAYL